MDAETKQEFTNTNNRIDTLSGRIDTLVTFLQKNMVTKEEFSELQIEVKEVKDSTRSLVTSVEGLATLIKNYGEEHAVIKHQISVMQNWMREVSKKVGIEFKL